MSCVGNLVRVEWQDISYDVLGWQEGQDAAELTPLECETTGRVIADGKGCIVLALTTSGDGGALQTTAIPRGCIKSITRLVPDGIKTKIQETD